MTKRAAAAARTGSKAMGRSMATRGSLGPAGARDSGPGLHLSGGASRNAFGTFRVAAMASAVSIGEGYLPLTNDGNTFKLVHAERCPYTVLIVRGGYGNRFERIVAVGCSTVDPASRRASSTSAARLRRTTS